MAKYWTDNLEVAIWSRCLYGSLLLFDRYQIDRKDFWSIFWMFCTATQMTCGFTKGVSVDVLYLLINDFFEVNLTYSQSDFTVNPGPTFCLGRK